MKNIIILLLVLSTGCYVTSYIPDPIYEDHPHTTELYYNGIDIYFEKYPGILNYLEYKKNKKTTEWSGECFVFDKRVSVNKSLKKGKYLQCYGCRHPITINDTKSKYFEKVSSLYFGSIALLSIPVIISNIFLKNIFFTLVNQFIILLNIIPNLA